MTFKPCPLCESNPKSAPCPSCEHNKREMERLEMEYRELRDSAMETVFKATDAAGVNMDDIKRRFADIQAAYPAEPFTASDEDYWEANERLAERFGRLK